MAKSARQPRASTNPHPAQEITEVQPGHAVEPEPVEGLGEDVPVADHARIGFLVDAPKFVTTLDNLIDDAFKSFERTGRKAAGELAQFKAAILPEIEVNLETAIRLGDKTHWDTLEIQASRVIMAGVRALDNFSAAQRQKIRDTALAAVGLLVKLAVTA